MARRWSFYRDLLPFFVMIGYEFSFVGLLTLFKAATQLGMNNHVFVAYSYAIGTTVLFPITFFNRRSRVVPPLSFSIICKIFLLGVIGSLSQMMGYTGISYSSPTLSSSIGNLVPAFTFMLAIIFSIVGAPIISIGLYAVLWGKATEDAEEDVGRLESPTTENVPLLHSYGTQTSGKKTDDESV